ncbi:MAG TPA: protein phosphatase 2C domain-containing protein [Bryobacteraceae bacterium]|nr:protein phosphatase 2C domain-containing protein [Bryobacteraceae bacterium]
MVKTNVKAAGASDMGRVRHNNEDAWYIDAERGIYLVVDGIGGQAAGEKAAEIAVECVRARLERATGAAEERIREAIAIANHEILRQAHANPEWEGMACVLTLALLENGSAVIGHVGDSRLYEIRGGAVRKITHDHSPVGEMEDAGELSEAEAMRHPRRNEVYRDVGSEEHAPDDPDFIEVIRIPFPGDSALLLCSDGLSDLVTSAKIRETVERHAGDPEAAARALIEAANRAGGKDNITVVIAEGERFAAPSAAAETPARMPWMATGIAAIAAALAGAAAGIAWQRAHTPPPVVIRPRVLSVGGTGQETFPTISAAIAAAHDGDTVEVPIGEYREQVELKSGVTVRSRVPREAVLLAQVVADGVRDARLSGFRIHGPQEPASPSVAVNNSAIEIDDNEIEGAQTGIQISGNAHAVLLGNAVHDCEAGVAISGPSQPWLSHNSFQRDKRGVAARDGARPLLVGNVFEKSPLDLPAEMDLKAVWEKNFQMDARSNARPAGGRARPEAAPKAVGTAK